MINHWFKYDKEEPKNTFTVIKVTEDVKVDSDIMSYLQKEILGSYKNLKYLKFQFENEPVNSLKEYLGKYALPNTALSGPSKNVWQGDVGEVLAELIVSYFNGLVVPIKKLRWKFNKDRSMFCTDMIAHNNGVEISDIYYYEIKTRCNIKNKETRDGLRAYATIFAHNSLLKDQNISPEGISSFLSGYYYDLSETEGLPEKYREKYREESLKYGDIVKNSKSYNRNFELFFITEKSSYIEDILNDLDALPPKLSPLNVTVVLIDNLKGLVDDLKRNIINMAVDVVYNK